MSGSIVNSVEEMMALGHRYAATAKGGDVFGLVGTLGTGKTHWAKGFMGFMEPEAAVASPTFALVNEYRGGLHPVFHFDFYRLESPDELLSLGWDEYLDEGAIIICEWANLFPDLMPKHTVWLEISHMPEGSRMVKTVEKPTVQSPAD